MEEIKAVSSFDKRDGPRLLPFEFIALEACLEATCTSLDNEVSPTTIIFLFLNLNLDKVNHFHIILNQAKTLEKEAYPALDKLTSKISTLNLDRVRQIKSRLVTITGRVQKVGGKYCDQSSQYQSVYIIDILGC